MPIYLQPNTQRAYNLRHSLHTEIERMGKGKGGKIPAFFKVFIPELCSNKMQIPPDFTSIMNGKLPDTAAFLRNRCGNVWAVDVSREGSDLYFDGGWVRFVKDNNIEMGDFLVFQLTGDRIYDFKHLGHSGCKKETVGSFRFTVKLEESEQMMGANEEEEEGEEDDDEDEEDEEEEDDDDDDDEDNEEEEEKVEEGGSKKSVMGKGVVDIFESGLIGRPKNPYFVLPPRKRPELRIPYEVITDHRLNIPEAIIISREDGWEFVAKVSTWGDGRKVIFDGWRAFRERYKMKEEWCLCEFLPPQSHKLLIRVLHLHEGKWIPRP